MPGGGRYTSAATSHWNQQAAAGSQGTWGGGSAATAAAPAAQASTTSKVNVTVETADTSNVPAQYKAIVDTLTRVYNQSASANTSAVGKRKMGDVNKRLGQLFERLNHNDISAQACGKLLQLCTALDGGDFAAASDLQVALTTYDWDENSTWIVAIKRLMDSQRK